MKNLNLENTVKKPTGFVRILKIRESDNKIVQIVEKPNLVLYSGADILAKLAGTGSDSYKIRTMYLEFQNASESSSSLSSSSGSVTPEFDRTGGIDYYNSLSTSANTDFLRLSISTSPSYSTSDAALYDNNVVTFFTLSTGLAGRHGKEFSHTVGSVVYGAALVASPVLADPASDIVFARTYFTSIEKQVGYQLGVQWAVTFE